MLRTPGRPALALPRRAYAGFPAAIRTFIAAATPDRDTTTLVRGKLARGKVTGSADLSVGTCTGVTRFTAKR